MAGSPKAGPTEVDDSATVTLTADADVVPASTCFLFFEFE